MATSTTDRERVTYKALQEPTMCAAFQVTAAEHPDRVALRTKGDEFSLTWGEYAKRVERIAAGLAALGLGRGDTIGLMLNNRPEFHLVDTAAMHLGATPYSVYNTYTPDQIAYLVGDAQNTPGRSLYVRLTGSDAGRGRAGKWTDAQNGDHGDLLDIIASAIGSRRMAETLD